MPDLIEFKSGWVRDGAGVRLALGLVIRFVAASGAGTLAEDFRVTSPDNLPEAWHCDKTFRAFGGRFNPNIFAT